ncbi:NUMOD4 domain-containing protein [Kordia sp.]|uniref:NUMOD4 domain-containing protein n=1 Tax=Kordia sp. TaxID=1965332 RepID=UPI0025C104A4|nr:NUMOD4 domain-containing protein [Kordia sp.]MCH2083127.1 HNH endonuclease [Saprospiraceae bacterium]MCH2193304.1 HNH endonuclease [Kordia sp.]
MSKAKQVKLVEDKAGEIWVKVILKGPTKQKDYYVSTYGRAKAFNRKINTEMELKGSLGRRGYKSINIRLVEGYQSLFIHKAIAENFVRKPSEKHTYILHKNHDTLDNRTSNLIWATEKEWKHHLEGRVEYKKRHGLIPKDKPKPITNNKLTETKVAIIKKWLKNNKTKTKIIAKKFNVSVTQIKRIERQENWAEVEAAS